MNLFAESIANERVRREAIEASGANEAWLAYVGELAALAKGTGDPARVLNAADLAGVNARQAERDVEIVREALELIETVADLPRRENELAKVQTECELEEEKLKLDLARVRQRRALAVTKQRDGHQAGLALDRLRGIRPELFEKHRAALVGSNNTTKRGKRG